MTIDGNDDHDIVVDDRAREDGLIAEPPSAQKGGYPLREEGTQFFQLAQSLPETLRRVEELLRRRDEREPGLEERVSSTLGDLVRRLDQLAERFRDLEERVEGLVARVAAPEAGMNEAAEPEAPSGSEIEPEAEAAGSGAEDVARWERLLLGGDLCGLDALALDRRELMAGVLDERAPVIGLASRLMLVRSADTEEVPPLLKEIGEAYYRWRPKNQDREDAFEQALVEALHKRIAEVGLRNSIELVRPGDRYDASRHLTTERGVEVRAVRGWVVLRDNGKPLTKAGVALK